MVRPKKNKKRTNYKPIPGSSYDGVWRKNVVVSKLENPLLLFPCFTGFVGDFWLPWHVFAICLLCNCMMRRMNWKKVERRDTREATLESCIIDYMLLKMTWEPGRILLTRNECWSTFHCLTFWLVLWGWFRLWLFCLGGFFGCCLCGLFFATWPFHSWFLGLPTISSLRYNDCHNRYDARSNGPKKMMWWMN